MRTSLKPLYMSFFLCLAFFLGTVMADEPVTAVGSAKIIDGESRARQNALKQALRAAVKKGVTTLSGPGATAKNKPLLSEKIYSHPGKYIKKYKILAEGQSPNNDLYTVTVQAVVSHAALEPDLKKLGIFKQ